MFPRAVKRVAIAFLVAFFGPAPLATAQDGEPPTLRRDAFIQDGTPLGIGRLVPDLSLQDTTGQTRKLSEALHSKRAIVIVMTSVGCPVSRRYAPRLAAIEDLYTHKGVSFVFVNTVRAESSDEIRRQIRDVGFDGLYLPDRAGIVAGALGARTTTEVFVLDAARTLVYRGAIDDQIRVGGAAEAAERHFLRDALDALLAGKKPATAATWAPGCLLDAPARTPQPAGDLTYYGRVARILADNCATCHRSDGPAPFSLDHYGAVVSRAAMIEAVVRDDLMPPTHGLRTTRDAEGRRLWKNDRTLDPADKRDLLAWLRSARPLGDFAERPVHREPPQTWVIGLPDAIYATPEMAVPAEGGLRHERIILPMGGDATRWITAVECRPMMRDTVHHAIVWLVQGTTEPGRDVVPQRGEFLAAYSPGDSVVQHAPGTARRIEPGARLVVDLYAKPMGRTMSASLRVAVRSSEKSAANIQSSVINGGPDFILPAGHTGVADLSLHLLDKPVLLAAITPIFGPRCVALTVDAVLPDGTKRRLLDLPTSKYDFRWRIRYELAEPLELPPGTRLVSVAQLDNTPENTANPNSGRDVTIGTGQVEEPAYIGVEWVNKETP